MDEKLVSRSCFALYPLALRPFRETLRLACPLCPFGAPLPDAFLMTLRCPLCPFDARFGDTVVDALLVVPSSRRARLPNVTSLNEEYGSPYRYGA